MASIESRHPRSGRPHGRRPLLHRRLRPGHSATPACLGGTDAPASAGSRCRSPCPSQPTVNGLIDAALDAGATSLKPAAKSFWGYGGVVQAPDGTIWKVATSAKKDTGPATRQIDQIVLLLGVADVAASKRFYVDRGLAVAKSFGRKYVEFATPSSPGQAGALRAPRPRQGRRRPSPTAPDRTGS